MKLRSTPRFLNEVIIFLSIFPPTFCCSDNDYFAICSNTTCCCGDVQGVSYPFWGGKRPQICGDKIFKLTCHNQQYPVIKIGKQRFRVRHIVRSTYTMAIERLDFEHHPCPDGGNLGHPILSSPNFDYTNAVRNLTLAYGCPMIPSLMNFNFTCQEGDKHTYNYYCDEKSWNMEPRLKKCESIITVPVDQTALYDLFRGWKTLREALSHDFTVNYFAHRTECYSCVSSAGVCGSSALNTSNFLCFHSDQPPRSSPISLPTALTSGGPGTDQPKSTSNKILIGLASATAGIVLSCTLVVFLTLWFGRRTSSSTAVIGCRKMRTKSDQNIEMFIRNHESNAPKRYSYSEVKKMTKKFQDKLGEGGYGIVYKGKLLDGCPVAVKILNTTKGTGGEFINEVASISRTSHVNIVNLLGFCFDGNRKALIYEYMANGSLEKFIYNRNTSKDGRQLGWQVLCHIAIGIARGLEYLHRGCNTRILHFDIKPHNILLDADFCPKIADFGHSKLCSRKESNTEVEHARGTFGYIAPEVCSRNFGKVSPKSDVFSYGMMVLEMVSGRKNSSDTQADRSADDIYFPHWIYKRLRDGNDLGLDSAVTKEENEIAKKMVLVGLWCIQVNPADRPSMHQVTVMLEGCPESLTIPPKPFMFSPSNSEGDDPPSAAPIS